MRLLSLIKHGAIIRDIIKEVDLGGDDEEDIFIFSFYFFYE